MSLDIHSYKRSSPRAADSSDHPSKRPRSSPLLPPVPYTGTHSGPCPLLQLNCLVSDDTYSRIFVVRIEAVQTVADLKKVIKEEKKYDFQDVDADKFDLWKVSIPVDHNFQESIGIPDGNSLLPIRQLSTVFLEPPVSEHIHIVVKGPGISNKSQLTGREWTVNGAIRPMDMDGCYYVDPGIQNESKHCLNALLRHQFVLLAGARASGKTTRLFWLKTQLEAKKYRVIYLSFKRVQWDNVQAFWSSFGLSIQAATSTGSFSISQMYTPLSSMEDFLTFFRVGAWNRSVVLVIDEFSDLYHASSIIQDEFLRAFRDIRNNQEPYAIRGIIAAGTFGISYLTPTFTTSPFNIVDHVDNPYFSIDETRKLFVEFAKDNLIMIDDAIIDDVWVKSNGHPGMVCLCGRAISEYLPHMLALPNRVLSYKSWQTFSAIHLHDRIYKYITFRTMIASLLREEAAPAVSLLHSHFVGFLDTVYIKGAEQEQQADFLTAEGVLLRSASHNYHVASAFVDGLIRRYFIPEKFPNAPLTPPPMTNDRRPRVLEVLTQSLKFFDKDLIRLAAARSYKQAKVKVGGLRGVCVPRESVYSTELMRILTNWLKHKAYAINCQWHFQASQNKDKYCDIVISKPTTATIVLELLATEDVSFVRAHIEKTSHYKDLLSADEAWVVHFTCEDDYLDHPTWQCDEQLQRGDINVVHFWHDQGFSTLLMSARWKDADGTIQEVDNQQVAL